MWNTLWNNTCILCHSVGINDINLCKICLQDLPALVHSCIQCALPLPEGISAPYCSLCSRAPLKNYRVFAPFLYASPISRLITKFKFKQDLSIAKILGKLMALHIEKVYSKEKYPQLLIPMPIHAARLRKIGYNQALELARPISKILQVQLNYDSCIRVRDTAPQANLPRQARLENLKNAFQVSAPLDYDHVCLVDDVMTTGFTALSCSKVLFETGVKKVDVLCCARAGIKN